LFSTSCALLGVALGDATAVNGSLGTPRCYADAGAIDRQVRNGVPKGGRADFARLGQPWLRRGKVRAGR